MRLRRSLAVFVALLVGGVPLATVGTCDRTSDGGSFYLTSSNDDLVQDALDILFGEEDD
ncbi:MAG: hypothetical protein GY842_21360 [bacterium]|nr:hypothetical protein [bacterium]